MALLEIPLQMFIEKIKAVLYTKTLMSMKWCQSTVLRKNAVSVQQQDIFDQSLANISSEHREIIILSRFQQLNYHEISSLLDCNLNTLKSKMRNAISKLHEQYNKLSGEVQ